MSGMAMSDPPPGGPSRSRRKPAAENWDDDFDFDPRMQDRSAAPRQSSSSTSASASARTHSRTGSLSLAPAHTLSKKPSQLSSKSGASRANSNEEPLVLARPPGGNGKGKGKAVSRHRDEMDIVGFDEEADEDAWDASPPRLGHGRPSLSLSTRRVSKGQAQPSPLVIPPRTSSATSSTSPLSHSASPLDGPYPQPVPHTAPPIGPNKLIKRHPSSSFALHSGNRYADANSSTSSLGSWSHLNRSTPSLGAGPPVSAANASAAATQSRTRQLRHMKSGDMMPPPPVPVQRRRSERAKRHSRGQPHDVVAPVPEGALPVSSSQEHLGAAQKPGFWRRMSGQLASPDEQRRRRSSSVGSPTKLRPAPVDAPPIPPLPANLRSPSSASTTSYHSGTSSVSVSMSTSTSMSRSNLGLSSILRRSTSNLANKLKGRSTPSGVEGVRVASGTSTHSVQSRGSRSSSQQSFSRGYHLPSPSPQSPYAEQAPLPMPLLSAMAQSHSRDPPISDGLSSEQDPEDGVQTTPRKRRPVSTVPPRSSAWSGEGWSGFPADASHRRAGSPSKKIADADALAPPLRHQPPLPPTPTEEAPRFATLKRLSSLSKKHGRRLSGGWKFGTSSSTSSDERPKLETVIGSPSKSGRVSPAKGEAGVGLGLGLDAGAAQDEREKRLGSISVPGSMFKTTPARSLAETFDKLEGRGVVGTPESTSSAAGRSRAEREARRQSWNDFVIPRNVLEKQRGLKEGIKEVKMFATGVEALRTLLSTHAALLSRVSAADGQTKSDFATIEKEFDSWWEMATVLIEVGSTGQGIAGSAASVEAPASPKRSRRITLASDQAQLASEMVRSRTAHGTGAAVTVHTNALPTYAKSSFLPSPSLGVDADPLVFDSLAGPPRASPDHWRASTGRQELSKRQLEVLRTMLRTPVSDPTMPARPHLVRGLSGLSTISAGTGAAVRAASPGAGVGGLGTPGGHGARPSMSRSGSAFAAPSRLTPASSPLAPSPSPRLHSHPPVSFSPAKSTGMALSASASGQRLRIKEHEGEGGPGGNKDMRPRQMRRASKVGLAGLKDFIRSLKGKERGSGTTSTSASASASASGEATPASAQLSVAIERTITREITLSPPSSAGIERELARRTSQVSVGDGAGSPTPRRRWVRPKNEERFAAGNRAPAPAPLPMPLPSPVASSAPDPALKRAATRGDDADGGGAGAAGGKGRRPGLRGIFRGGSGNWGELVAGAGAKSPTYPVPPHTAPVPPTTRQSSDPVRPVGGLRVASQTHSVRSTPGTVRLDDGAFAGMGVSAGGGQDFGASRKHSGCDDPAKGSAADMDADVDMDMTVRPRKSRILGLGWPEAAPAVPSQTAPGLPGRSSSGQSAQSSQSAVSRGSRFGGVPGWGGAGAGIPGVGGGGGADRRDVSGSTASSRAVSDTWSEDSDSGRLSLAHGHGHGHGTRAAKPLSAAIAPAPPRASNESGRSDLTTGTTDSVLDAAGVIALTPENLPVLLEYLRQCQGKLGEWRVRVEGLGLGSGE